MGNKLSKETNEEVDIGHFKLQQVIGKGGFGVVRIVQKRDTKTKYALKYINKKRCIKKGSVRNIFRERLILEKCDHPFIINLQFAFQDDQHMFMVLDLALGGDLRFHLLRVGCLPEQTVRIYTAEIASALQYLHANEILHRYPCRRLMLGNGVATLNFRDLKPENLLLDENGHVHITDFNVAIMLNEKIPTSKSGTTSYMGMPRILTPAPEMFIRKPYKYSVDWWALGIILYECTYNLHPFMLDKRIPVEKAICESRLLFPSGSDLRPGRYPYVESPHRTDFIRRLLEKNVADRLGANGANDIKGHPWMAGMDWQAVMRKGLVPEFIPDPNQNNYDFGAALEELLYESSPLGSKPVKKRRNKKERTPSLASLWIEEQISSGRNQQSASNKMEDELDYIEEYFESYVKPPVAKLPPPYDRKTNPPAAEMRNYSSAASNASVSISSRNLAAFPALTPPQPYHKPQPVGNSAAASMSPQSLSKSFQGYASDTTVKSGYKAADEAGLPKSATFAKQEESRASMDSLHMEEQLAFKLRPKTSTGSVQSATFDYDLNEDPIPPMPDSLKLRAAAGKKDFPVRRATPGLSEIPARRAQAIYSTPPVTDSNDAQEEDFAVRSRPRPLDIFNNQLNELDLNFPEKEKVSPEVAKSPRSPTTPSILSRLALAKSTTRK
ncbi:hypothetical protein HDV03_004912 [Kappamyces sp. JEL0829]|nr:hypothetical protein HDV03_004912 [Kappamyces sp. JEL0829]